MAGGLRSRVRPSPSGSQNLLREMRPSPDAHGEAERQSLAGWIEARGLGHAGDWQMAGYNPPWTIPMLRRNEVLVTLSSCP